MKFENGSWSFEVLPNEGGPAKPVPAPAINAADPAVGAIALPADPNGTKPAALPATPTIPLPVTGVAK
jgi:hypothetical protein